MNTNIYIKDLLADKNQVRIYGTNPHDSLKISDDGRFLSYYNLQNGDGSFLGDYRFCDEEGLLPCDIKEYGVDVYANIGGFNSNYFEEFENLFIHKTDYKQFFKDTYGAKEPDYNLYDLVAKYGAKKVLDDFIHWKRTSLNSNLIKELEKKIK